MIYHGSCISGLHTIKANSKSHSTGNFVAYFSEDRCYALVCCRSRDENFVTMGVGADGKQHYIERFPNQLEALYKGRQGYIYLLDSTDGLTHGKGHSWESKHDVPISQCESIADVYREGSLFTLFPPCWGHKSAQKMPGFSSPVTHIITHFFLVPLWEAEIQHKQNPGIASRVFAV